MKFTLLPVGQRFSYQGETLIKVGPMTACNEGGGNARLIPRSAVVATIGTTEDPAPQASTHLDVKEIEAALDQFEARWRTALAGLDAATQGQLEPELTSALQALRVSLGIGMPPAA